MQESSVLIGKEKICAYLDIGRKMFRKLIQEGMPAQKKMGRWVAHKQILDDYFRQSIKDASDSYGVKDTEE